MTMKLSVIVIATILHFSNLILAQNVRVIDVVTLEKILNESNSDTRVVNFWATWCKPCIEELPYFEALRDNPLFNEVEVILISLDFVSDLDSRVNRFVEKQNIQSTVMLLDDTDYNSWINKIEQSWSGAIPATMFIQGETGKRIFFEKQFEPGELENELTNFIKH